MQVELFYFDGCPNYKYALKNLETVLKEFRVAGPVRLVRVETPEDALQHRFLGSPSIRVNGRDIEESAEARQDYALQCRIYFEDGRAVGYPSIKVLKQALSRYIA